MRAEIISVGTELLLGDIVNSNSQFLARELAAYGIDTIYQSTVGDNRERLKQALELALSRCDAVVLTGGLGPTEDDLTRETVAECLGLPLELHEESDERIRAYFERTEREYTENNRKQAMLPKGCEVFPNDHGTAPGCAIEQDGKRVVLLPGPPREMVPMFFDQVAAYLTRCSGGTIHSHTVGVFGIPEAAIDERLHDLMQGENPTVAPYAKNGEVVLRITAKADTEEQADVLCDPIISEIRERLGNAVYGVDAGGLAKRVVTLLTENGLKIATAESCTAGLLSGRLTEIAGVSSVFECGVAAYSKEIKHQVLGVPAAILEKRGAVSSETAAAMAVGACRISGADIGVGITGVAGPDTSEGKSVGTVFVALADHKRVWVRKVFAGHTNEDRETIRNMATLYALDMARRYLEAFPGVMAGGQSLEEMQAQVEELNKTESENAKRRRRQSALLRWLCGAFAVLLALGLWAYPQWYLPYQNQKSYDGLADMYAQATPETEGWYPSGILSQFMTLYRNNDAVRGWVHIADTRIHYPVMADTVDAFYRTHDFYKKESDYGAPYYIDDGTQGDAFANRQSVTVYGNGPENGQMFADLSRYTELSFLKAHPLIELNSLYQKGAYKVFAVLLTDDTDEAEYDYAKTAFADEDTFFEHVSQLRIRSLFDTLVDVMEGDRLLLLTAPIDYGYEGARIVVAARRVRSDEAAENDLTKARINRVAVMPKGWREQNPTAQTTTETTTTTTTETTTETTTTETTTATTTTTQKTTGKTTKKTTTTKASTTKTTTTQATTTTEAPTTTQAPARPNVPIDGTAPNENTVQGTIAESQFLEKVAVVNDGGAFSQVAADADGVIRPKSKEDLQMILTAIVKQELGSSSTMINSVEAQKAQAVASYTYVLWYNLGGNAYWYTMPTVNLNNSRDKKVYDAVGEVLGVKLMNTQETVLSNRMVLQAVYSASTGGFSSSSQRVWSNTFPYLQTVYSKYDDVTTNAKYHGKNFSGTKTMTRDELYQKVKDWFAKTYPQYTMPEEQFDTSGNDVPLRALTYDGDGSAGNGDAWNYVYQTNFYYLTAKGTKRQITGHQMRSALGLNSHAFRVSYDPATKVLTINTQGWGHGSGLSQMGAVGYANEEGWSYIQILKHYYSITDTSNHQVVMPIW
ncbi:MAG: competence/damage-inducible protein A [Clostridia bacterium]|nr:competence/damage-inducible protein A [Clostridia bacterium]